MLQKLANILELHFSNLPGGKVCCSVLITKEQLVTQYFLPVQEYSWVKLLVAKFLVVCADSFTDSSIIRANGQSSNPGVLKELEPWDGGSDDVTDDPLAVQLDDPDAVSPFSP